MLRDSEEGTEGRWWDSGSPKWGSLTPLPLEFLQEQWAGPPPGVAARAGPRPGFSYPLAVSRVHSGPPPHRLSSHALNHAPELWSPPHPPAPAGGPQPRGPASEQQVWARLASHPVASCSDSLSSSRSALLLLHVTHMETLSWKAEICCY